MADDIRGLSAELARDPSSLKYVLLADLLRRRGKLAEALQCAMHGLGRHPEHADGWDTLARIHTDRAELNEARAAWERALAIVPEHAGALKGIGFLYYRQGDTRRAVDALEHAVAANPSDEQAIKALTVLRGDTDLVETAEMEIPPTPQAAGKRLTEADVPQLRATASALLAKTMGEVDAKAPPPAVQQPSAVSHQPSAISQQPSARPLVFSGLEGATADILLLDARGLVMAGGLRAPDGSDASELAAAALAGVSGEAGRTAGYLNVGTWSTIVAEAEHANVVLTPVGEGALLMLRRDKSTPVGLALRVAERARAAAAKWLEEQAP